MVAPTLFYMYGCNPFFSKTNISELSEYNVQIGPKCNKDMESSKLSPYGFSLENILYKLKLMNYAELADNLIKSSLTSLIRHFPLRASL